MKNGHLKIIKKSFLKSLFFIKKMNVLEFFNLMVLFFLLTIAHHCFIKNLLQFFLKHYMIFILLYGQFLYTQIVTICGLT